MRLHITYSAESEDPANFRIDWLKWAIFFGFWTLFGFLNANQTYFEMRHTPGMHHSWWRIAFWQLLVWNAWGALTPIILSLGRRFPERRASWLRGILVHLPISVIVAAMHVAAATYSEDADPAVRRVERYAPVSSTVQDGLRGFFLFDFFVYWAILGVGYAFDYRDRYREREATASQLKAQLAQAQLESLKMQLHPHFLFNTLHTIAGLVRGNERSQPLI